jgi:short-subunit dehydrogenase
MIFKDKTVIITGGSEGIGAATARGFAEAGANLLLVARNRKKLEALAQELRDKTRVEIFAMDVADPDASVDLFKKADYDFGRIDILVNNAGCHERGPVEKVEAAELARMVDVNLRAPILLSRLALPYLRDAGGGVIVNVGSLYGRTPAPGQAAYCATKAGLRFFTRALAEELRNDTIKVALVAPGPVDTGFIMDNLDRASDLTFSQPMTSRYLRKQQDRGIDAEEHRDHRESELRLPVARQVHAALPREERGAGQGGDQGAEEGRSAVNASRVRFSQPSLRTRTLSSMRMPPKGRIQSTVFQLTILPAGVSLNSSSSMSIM